jgi:hypothetical protein
MHGSAANELESRLVSLKSCWADRLRDVEIQKSKGADYLGRRAKESLVRYNLCSTRDKTVTWKVCNGNAIILEGEQAFDFEGFDAKVSTVSELT